MTDRKWMPSEYADEVVPPPRPTPDAWIITLSDGAHALAGGEPYGEDAGPGRALKEGDVVNFDWTENFGNRELTFHKSDDGWKWTLDGDEPLAPPDGYMNVAEVGDWETAMPSLDEFAETYSDSGVEDGETITVTFYAWSANDVPFVFRGGKFHATVAMPATIS